MCKQNKVMNLGGRGVSTATVALTVKKKKVLVKAAFQDWRQATPPWSMICTAVGTEPEFELTYPPGQSVLEAVHVEQSERDHEFELGVDLNSVMHAQQLLTGEGPENQTMLRVQKASRTRASRLKDKSPSTPYFRRYSSESHSFRTWCPLVAGWSSSSRTISSIRLFTVLSTGWKASRVQSPHTSANISGKILSCRTTTEQRQQTLCSGSAQPSPIKDSFPDLHFQIFREQVTWRKIQHTQIIPTQI